MFKYNNKVSFRSVAPPGSKHGQDPKTKKEMESWLKDNVEEKNKKRYAGKGFDQIINQRRTVKSIIYYFK